MMIPGPINCRVYLEDRLKVYGFNCFKKTSSPFEEEDELQDYSKKYHTPFTLIVIVCEYTLFQPGQLYMIVIL